jgi:hypothetical protein
MTAGLLLLVAMMHPARECELSLWLRAPSIAIRDSADIVVHGTILGFEEADWDSWGSVEIAVERSWREQVTDPVKFLYDEECSPRLEIGETYYIGVFRYNGEPWVFAALADRDSTSLIAFLSRTNVLQPVPPREHSRSLSWFVIGGVGVIAVATLLARRRRGSHVNEG